MKTLPAYELKQTLWTTASATAYSGARRSDSRPVIIKCVPRDSTSPDNALARLQREYRLTSRLQAPCHLPTLGQDNIDGYPVFIYEDTPHRPLAQTHREHEQPRIADALHLAIELTKALNALHARHIVHRNIGAHSVLWEPTTRQIRLTDFGLAHSQTEPDTLSSNGVSSPTDPAYTSPEMTGRIDQPVDLRSDLYSLGVLLYEQFTGSLPFPDADMLSVVHGHLAIVPTSPAAQNPELPGVVSDILLKLLEKMAGNRYQTGHSLLADLERCRTEYHETGNIRPFPIGTADPHDQFHISDTLYGRAREIDALQQAWNQTCDHCGQTVFILGAAGTGKTRLTQELQHRVDAQGGLFLTGKFEQSDTDIPYQGFVRVVESLTRHLLSLDDTSLQQWRTRLRRAVTPNGGILTSLVPQLEQILGPQTDIATPGATESRNRFNQVLLQFFAAIADAEHPTVLHLDDLHWADPASLDLLSQLAKNHTQHHLLLLSGYRHKTITAQHPITALRDTMGNDNTAWTDIALDNLPTDAIIQLLRDSLRGDQPHIQGLATSIIGNTQGNPLFTKQLLQQMHDDGLITRNNNSDNWQFTGPTTDDTPYATNIVEFLGEKLNDLPHRTRHLLQIAACLGNRFQPSDLAAIAQLSETAITATLEPARFAGLIAPQGQRYQFVHDRMQQAADASIAEPSRAPLYLSIARRLSAVLPKEEQRERLFELTHYWNAAREKITEDRDLQHVIKLNQSAAHKANAANAYHTALGFAKHATQLLHQKNWGNHPELTFNCHFELARNQYLAGDITPALNLARDLLQRSNTLADNSRCYALIKDIITNQGSDYPLAVHIGRETLNRAGIAIPAPVAELSQAVSRARHRVEALLPGRRHEQQNVAEQLSTLPYTHQGKHKHRLRLLMDLWEAAYYQGDTRLMELCALHMVEQSLQHGNASESAFGYVLFAMHLTLAGQHSRAYQFGAFALELNGVFNDRILLPKITNLFCNYTAYFKQPFADIAQHYERSARIARENGDYLFGVWATFFRVWSKLLAGHPLPEVYQSTLAHQDFVEQTHDKKMQRAFRMLQLGLLHLMGEQGEGEFLHSADDELGEMLAHWQAERFIPGQCWYAILAGQINTLLGYAPQALEGYARYGRENDTAIVMFPASQYDFFQCLAELNDLPQADAAERARRLQHSAQVIERLAPLAQDCPDNFGYQYWLLRAETARIDALTTGDTRQTALHFGKALETVQDSHNLYANALTNELIANFWRQQGNAGFASQFTHRAFHLYRQWGAKSKTAQLAHHLTNGDKTHSAKPPGPDNTNRQLDTGAMDMAAILQSAQAISEETDIRKLLERIVRICTEQTGAQRGVLITPHAEGLNVECVVESAPRQRADTQRTPLDKSHDACHRIIRLAARTHGNVMLGNASREDEYRNHPYIKQRQIKSVLCVPFFRRQQLAGVIYLENNLASNVFTEQRLETLRTLLGQAAISLENARAHSALQQSEQRIRQSHHYANIGSWEWNITSGELYWSDNVAPMFGLGEKILKTSLDAFFESVHPDDRERVARATQDSIEHGIPYNIEHRILWPDGSLHWVNEVAEVVRSAHGAPQRMIGIVRNITDVVTAREQQKQTERQHQQAKKMEAVGQLTGGIAHDFNNMLASILGYSDLLKAENERQPNESISRYLAEIIIAGKRASNLVTQLQAFSRNEAGKTTLVDLATLIDETLTLVRAALPAHIELHEQLDRNIGPVLADPMQIQQVLMNLCTNARDAVEPPGHITLSLHRVTVETDTCASCQETISGDYVRLSVTNSGTPIPPDVAIRIFDPFFTTKEVGAGSGMGLAVCHGVVHACGGHITLNTGPHDGVTFSLLLPPHHDAAILAAPGKAPTAQARVMVVDNERSIVALLTDTLETVGCTVTAFFDSTEALRRFEQGPDDFDLVVTDQNMPTLTGMKLAERMLAQRPQLPIVLSSEHSANVDENTALTHGIKACLEKPYRPSQLIALISRLLS